MRLKVLQLCHKPPFPSIDGGCLEMAKMSTFFDSSAEHDLTVLSFHTSKHPFVKASFEQNLKNSKYKSVFVDVKPKVVGALSNLIKRKSYNLTRFYSEHFKSELLKLLKENTYDIIQLESIFTAKYIPEIRKNSKAKIVLNSPNVEYEIWKRLAKETSNVLKSNYFSVLAKQLKREELEIYSKVDAIIAITKKDEALYKKIVPNIKHLTVPFTLNLSTYEVKELEKKEIAFFHIGSMNWMPNIAGVTWFIDEVWDKNYYAKKGITFNIAGMDMPTSFFDYAIPNVNVKGFVEDAKEFIGNHDVMIVPLFSGSGLRVKIIEAMAMGKCVIATAVGAEGINYENEKNILIANNSSEFKKQIDKLIANPSIICKIGVEARKLVETHYNSVRHKDDLNSFYKTLI